MNSKSSDLFKKTILEELTKRAQTDSLFAASFQKPGKTIDECINYIINTVHKSEICGFADDEIFGMAAHYYDEDDIGTQNPMDCSIISNHYVSLTPEEILEAKKQAKEKVLNEEIQRLRSKPVVIKKPETNTLSFEF
jgi:hypothetical protein